VNLWAQTKDLYNSGTGFIRHGITWGKPVKFSTETPWDCVWNDAWNFHATLVKMYENFRGVSVGFYGVSIENLTYFPRGIAWGVKLVLLLCRIAKSVMFSSSPFDSRRWTEVEFCMYKWVCVWYIFADRFTNIEVGGGRWWPWFPTYHSLLHCRWSATTSPLFMPGAFSIRTQLGVRKELIWLMKIQLHQLNLHQTFHGIHQSP